MPRRRLSKRRPSRSRRPKSRRRRSRWRRPARYASTRAGCIAPSDPNVVWVGTGEHNARNSVSWGDGVYKSADGGKSWQNMGLRRSFQIGRIAIHPQNPDVVYVGALGRLWGPSEERGVFRTSDGGRTWQKVLYVDD